MAHAPFSLVDEINQVRPVVLDQGDHSAIYIDLMGLTGYGPARRAGSS